ncbi:hypothetical protein FGO68_gene14871 [Halteria grandinella]|uniref:Transmembrane protein n=1 Tax=Halteria grandinella TaxID=5974 RepID=A0A8J8NHQ9_HALGN|nr:hypothetical protein FGO68_gene14871 [Halteria grandinella]
MVFRKSFYYSQVFFFNKLQLILLIKTLFLVLPMQNLQMKEIHHQKTSNNPSKQYFIIDLLQKRFLKIKQRRFFRNVALQKSLNFNQFSQIQIHLKMVCFYFALILQLPWYQTTALFKTWDIKIQCHTFQNIIINYQPLKIILLI